MSSRLFLIYMIRYPIFAVALLGISFFIYVIPARMVNKQQKPRLETGAFL